MSSYFLVAAIPVMIWILVILFFVCCCKRKYWSTDFLPNEHVGHIEELTRDALEDQALEDTNWKCDICAFRNLPECENCVLCHTPHGVFILVAPEFENQQNVIPLDKLSLLQYSARMRKGWRRVMQDNGVIMWEIDPNLYGIKGDYVLEYDTLTQRLVLKAFDPSSGGVLLNGAELSSWQFKQIQEIQSFSFSIKYSLLVTSISQLASNYSKFKVYRAQIFDISLPLLRAMQTEYICSKTLVTLLGENGVDAGGVTREWYTILTNEIMDPERGLFIVHESDQSFFINPNSESHYGFKHLDLYRAVGRLIGRSIIDGQVLPFRFSIPLFKLILGYPLSIEDIQYLDPTIYKSLSYILHTDDVESLALTFSANIDALTVVDLVQDGRGIAVTNTNKAMYVDCMVRYLLFDRVSSQMNQLLCGLHEVIPPELLIPFDYKELEFLLCGSSNIDVTDWKRSTNVSVELLDVVDWFWDIVEHEMTSSDRARLLQFTTGSSRVPPQGFKALTSQDGRLCPYSLHAIPCVTRGYPRVHSCFNRIDLPVYTSREALRDGLFTLIQMESNEFTIA